MHWEDSKVEHDAWMVDISARGARVRTALVLLAGQIVGMLPSSDTGQANRYRVVWVERSSSGCLAGLELLETSQA
jgi:PilZ domain